MSVSVNQIRPTSRSHYRLMKELKYLEIFMREINFLEMNSSDIKNRLYSM